MSKYDMREAIYSQSEGAIVPRSKSMVWPIVVTMVGVGLLVLNAMIEATVQNGNLKSALLLFGAIFAIAGVVMVVVRLSGASKAPYCVKLDLENAEEPGSKLPTSTGSWKKQERSRKTSISALLTMPKPLTVWITINCGKF